MRGYLKPIDCFQNKLAGIWRVVMEFIQLIHNNTYSVTTNHGALE